MNKPNIHVITSAMRQLERDIDRDLSAVRRHQVGDIYGERRVFRSQATKNWGGK